MTNTYMIYPVYHREGYGWQVDNPEGTDGLPLLYALYEECSDGGEGYEIVSFRCLVTYKRLQTFLTQRIVC